MYPQGVKRRTAASAVRSFYVPGSQDAEVQSLERRTLFSVAMSFEGLVNTAKFPANQSETAIAINRANQNNIFVSSNYGAFQEPDQGPNDPIAEQGIFTTFSLDGGATWTPRVIAAGADTFPIACCDPSAAFDDFGNLYFIYLAMNPSSGATSIVVLVSSDGGQTFAQSAQFPGGGAGGSVDRPEVAVTQLPDGSAGIAVTFVDFDPSVDSMQCVMAKATGLGLTSVGPWGPVQTLPQSGLGSGLSLPANVGHPSFGPNGQVMVTWQTVGSIDKEKIYVNTDPDGPGPLPFGNSVFVDDVQVGTKEPLPSQPVRGLSAVATLAYDRSTGPNRGRAYLTYTQQTTKDRRDALGFPIGATSDTDVMLRFSDDNGATWSPAFRVNDDPTSSLASQFFQRVAVDPTTGNVALGWLDTRDDTNGQPNDEIGFYATVGQPAGNGIVFAPNIRLNVGESNARFSGNFGNDFGDYIGVDFYNGVLRTAYPDNSNSTGDNPSGRLRAFDIYATTVRVTDTTVPMAPFVTPASPLSPTVGKLQSLVRRGRFYQLKITYSHPSGIDLTTVNNDDILVTGPNGFSQPMQLVRAKAQKKGGRAIAIYRLAAPGGTWDAADNGVYTLTLQAGAISSADHTVTSAAGTITRFNVNGKAIKVKGSRRDLSPAVVPTAAQAVAASIFGANPVLSDRKGDASLRLLA